MSSREFSVEWNPVRNTRFEEKLEKKDDNDEEQLL